MFFDKSKDDSVWSPQYSVVRLGKYSIPFREEIFNAAMDAFEKPTAATRRNVVTE